MPHTAAQDFFDDFVAAFSHFNGPLIATRYAAPYLAVKADGSTRLFAQQAEIGHYFQSVVERYHQQGARTCRHQQLAVAPLSPNCQLATVTWELLTDNGAVMSAWRESYTLVHRAEGWRIVSSMDHAES